MDDSTKNVLLIAAIILVGIIVYKLCVKKEQRDNFTRTPMSSCNNCQFIRTPVDYVQNQHRNPHHIANPENHYQPLENNPIDLYSEERKLDNGELWQHFGNNFIDGIKTPYIVNDNKTRTLLTEVGDFNLRRVLDNEPVSNLTDPSLGPLITDADMIHHDQYPQNHPRYGGPKYFEHTQIGS